jgi:hypothetical protein
VSETCEVGANLRKKKPNTNTSTLKQYNQHAITKLKHIMQA